MCPTSPLALGAACLEPKELITISLQARLISMRLLITVIKIPVLHRIERRFGRVNPKPHNSKQPTALIIKGPHVGACWHVDRGLAGATRSAKV